MPSIRHHLTIAQASLITARAHLESAFEHTVTEKYDSRWTNAIDTAISETATSALQIYNIRTLIEPPATDAPPKEYPAMKAPTQP